MYRSGHITEIGHETHRYIKTTILEIFVNVNRFSRNLFNKVKLMKTRKTQKKTIDVRTTAVGITNCFCSLFILVK